MNTSRKNLFIFVLCLAIGGLFLRDRLRTLKPKSPIELSLDLTTELERTGMHREEGAVVKHEVWRRAFYEQLKQLGPEKIKTLGTGNVQITLQWSHAASPVPMKATLTMTSDEVKALQKGLQAKKDPATLLKSAPEIVIFAPRRLLKKQPR